MTTRDWFTDCSTLFMRHSCKILSAVGLTLFSASLWYANRIEDQTNAINETLRQIELDVAIIRSRQATTRNPRDLAAE